MGLYTIPARGILKPKTLSSLSVSASEALILNGLVALGTDHCTAHAAHLDVFLPSFVGNRFSKRLLTISDSREAHYRSLSRATAIEIRDLVRTFQKSYFFMMFSQK